MSYRPSWVGEVHKLVEFVYPSKWQKLPYASGWSDYSTTFPWYGIEFRRCGGKLEFRGLAKNSNVDAGTSDVVGTLPVRFRPERDFLQYVGASGGTTATVRVDVQADGDVIVTGQAGQNILWLSMPASVPLG